MVSAAQALVFPVFFLFFITFETQANNVLLGESCTVDRNCISAQTVCEGNTCRCFRGHFPSEDRRSCIATTRGLCFEESDCRSLQSSSCFIVEAADGTCMCNEGHTSSQDTTRCLPNSSYRGSCEERQQCTARLGNFAVCTESRCECQVQFHFSLQDGQCIRSIGLDGNCVNSTQCVAGGVQNNAVCENGRCSCSRGFVRAEDTCRAGAQNVIVSGTVFLLYWIIKIII